MMTNENGLAVKTEQEALLEKEVTTVEKQASAIVIQNDEDMVRAKQFVANVKSVAKRVEEFWKPLWDASYRAYKTVMDRKKSMIDPLTNAEKTAKAKISQYVAEQERKRKEEAERIRKLAQEEMNRKLEEAAQAESNGDAVGAEYAMAEAEAYESASLAKIPVQATKVEGMQQRKTWEIDSIDLSKLPCEFAGVMLRPADEKAILNLIKATKGQIAIPGVKHKEKFVIAVKAS